MIGQKLILSAQQSNEPPIDWPNTKKERKKERARAHKTKNKKYQTESILRMNTQTNSIMQAIQLKSSIESARARSKWLTVGRFFFQRDYVATESE